jgi:ubiquinone/menaquinone biosynthesis C-methylase UbiE
MFEGSAEYYDLIYSAFKNYPSEASQVADLLHRLHPACRTILDAACGTGEHARLLSDVGFDVDGLDLDPALLRIARQKHPAGRFFEADMSEFRFPDRYDAVTCRFSSIGYLRTLDRVERALTCFRGIWRQVAWSWSSPGSPPACSNTVASCNTWARPPACG